MMLRAMLAFAIGVAIASLQAPPQTPVPAPKASPTPPTPSPEPPQLKVSWPFQLAALENDKEVHWLTPGASRVFVSSRGAGTTAHDVTDGRVVWKSDEASEAAPAAAGEHVVLVGADHVQVLEQNAGRQVFRAGFTGTPVEAFANADRIGIALEGGLQAWDRTGTTPWHAVLSGKPVTPVVSSGDLFIVGTDEPALVAFDATTGAKRWTVTLPTLPLSLAGTADRVYFGGDDKIQYSYRTTGDPKPAWQSPHVRRIGTVGQPIVDGKSVYFALLDNSVRAFDAKGGSQRWDEVVESRPLTGPMKLENWLAVPLRNGRIALLPPTPKKGEKGPPTSATATGSVRLITAAAAPDGSRVYTITIANDTTRVLSAWVLKTAEPKR